MVEVVDSIIAELVARDNGYIAMFEKAIGVNRRLGASIRDLQRLGSEPPAKYGQDVVGSATVAANAHERAAARIKQARKTVSDADKQSATDAKAAAKAQSDAAKAIAKAQAEAEKAAARRQAAEERAAAKAVAASEAERRRAAERIAQLRAEEEAAANQARAATFLSGARPTLSTGITGLSNAGSARTSASVFQEQFRVEASAAKEAAAAEAALAKARGAAGDAAAAAAAKEAERDERLARVVAEAAAGSRVPQATREGRVGSGVAVPAGGSFTPDSPVRAEKAAEVEAEREINHLLADRFDLAQRARAAEGEVKRSLQDEAAYLLRINTYRRAGLSDEQAVLRAEAETAAIAAERAKTQARNSTSGKAIRQFAEGATLGYGPATATFAGVAAAGGVAAVAALAKQGLEYASSLKQVSDQLGLTTRDLQIYQTAAVQAGVKTEQFREAASQLAENLGRAQQGGEEQSKIFKALNIDIGNAQSGYKNLSQILPTLVDRLSKIPDQSRRFAIETALGGEQLRRLDPILSGGAAKFDALAASIEKAGGVLSDQQIQNADQTARKLELLGDQLQRDLASTVANNATAIEGLATAFLHAAEGALKFFNAMQDGRDLDVLNSKASPSNSFIAAVDRRFPILAKIDQLTGAGAYSDDDRSAAISRLTQRPTGRQLLLDRNAAALAELNRVDASYKNDGKEHFTRLPDGREVMSLTPSALNTDIPGLEGVEDTSAGRYAAYVRLNAERRRILAADRAAKALTSNKPKPGNPGDTSNLFAPKGKSADQLEREAAARQRRFEDQLAQSQEEELRAREQMTGDVNEQAEIEKDLVARALSRRLADIDLEVKAKQIDAANAGELKAAARAAAAAETRAIALEQSGKLAAIDAQHAQTTHDIQGDLIDSQLGLARTQKERLALALRSIDNDRTNERRELQDQLAQLKPGDPARADIQARIDTVDQRYAGREQQARQQYTGPLADYIHSLPHSADEVRESFERAAVNGVQALNDRLSTTIASMLKLHGLAGQFLADLIKIAIEREEVAIADQLFGKKSTGGTGGVASKAGLIASIASAFGIGGTRAAGGNVVGGVAYEVGELGRERFVAPVSGKIVPNNDLVAAARGGAMQLTQYISIDGRNSVTPADFASQIISAANEHADRAAAASGRAAYEGSPARIARMQVLGN